MSEEKIRSLINAVEVHGKLAELEVYQGETKEGYIPYVSITMKIQYGESPVETARVRMFSKALTKDNTDNRYYEEIQKFAKSAVPMTASKNGCSIVHVAGELLPNDYVNEQGELVELVEIRGSRFSKEKVNDFDPNMIINVEGSILSIKDEEKNGEPTGRKLMSVITTTTYTREAVVLKNIVIPEDLVTDFEEFGYEEGSTSAFTLTYKSSKKESTARKGGIGKMAVINDEKLTTELTLVGAEEIMTGAKELSSSVVKNLRKERKNKLDQLMDEGYKGSGSSKKEAPAPQKKASKAKTTVVTEEDDDDLPF